MCQVAGDDSQLPATRQTRPNHRWPVAHFDFRDLRRGDVEVRASKQSPATASFPQRAKRIAQLMSGKNTLRMILTSGIRDTKNSI